MEYRKTFSIFYAVNIEIVLDEVKGVGSHWWLPLLVWFAYFFWSRFLDYPAALETFIKNNKTWPYLPMYWKGSKRKAIRFLSLLLFWLGNLFFACVLFRLSQNLYIAGALFIIGIAMSIFVEFRIRYYATEEIIRLQRDRHFQIYTSLADSALKKGNEISDSELFSRAQWQHQNDLRLADKQGKLMEYLRGEAKL
jgi:hypothetical protein